MSLCCARQRGQTWRWSSPSVFCLGPSRRCQRASPSRSRSYTNSGCATEYDITKIYVRKDMKNFCVIWKSHLGYNNAHCFLDSQNIHWDNLLMTFRNIHRKCRKVLLWSKSKFARWRKVSFCKTLCFCKMQRIIQRIKTCFLKWLQLRSDSDMCKYIRLSKVIKKIV